MDHSDHCDPLENLAIIGVTGRSSQSPSVAALSQNLRAHSNPHYGRAGRLHAERGRDRRYAATMNHG